MIVRSCSGLKQFHFLKFHTPVYFVLFSLAAYQSSKNPTHQIFPRMSAVRLRTRVQDRNLACRFYALVSRHLLCKFEWISSIVPMNQSPDLIVSVVGKFRLDWCLSSWNKGAHCLSASSQVQAVVAFVSSVIAWVRVFRLEMEVVIASLGRGMARPRMEREHRGVVAVLSHSFHLLVICCFIYWVII